jgi:FdhD protein
MLATPHDVEELAVGLALTERLVERPQAIEQVTISRWLGELTVDLTIPPDRLRAGALADRTLAGNSGCGLCGLESLAALHARQGAAGEVDHAALPIDDAAILRAFAALPALQPLNAATHSVHAAAWCRPDGELLLVREDVGRHNALDKLVGALGRGAMLGTPGFVVMTSRCSYELVAKASVTGARLLATISAPTTLALTWSASLRLPVACLGPGRSVVRFPVELAHAAR